MSNFEKVKEFNTVFGVLKNDESLTQQQIINSAMNLIREEVKELEDAISTNNSYEIIDALTDILYVVYGMGLRLDIDLDYTFDLVHKNNMSKLCSDENEAQKTVQAYKERGINCDYRQAGNFFAVFNTDTKKILKAALWKPINWADEV
jgi:predicted HAD superfamily Cof-like phosphohydrolase